MTRISTPARRRRVDPAPDRSDLFALLQDSLVPDLPALEALLDRIERLDGGRR